ncbi:hypothetical protein JKP88DRAFT_254269 [Tribonema minus]|uniref:Uncharacterized protein n=1 Tax=Tribonema minus TaxID=303371 RepID=A0A835Z8S2_9STRA|nr:hypothetical protein JKP88DRAFT_254269 [Tribonema minus]
MPLSKLTFTALVGVATAAFWTTEVVSPATPAGVISQLLLRRKVVSLTAEGCFSSCTKVPLPSTLTCLKLKNVRGGFAANPLPPSLTSLAMLISGEEDFIGDDAVDIRQARMATLIAAAPPTLTSLEVDCFSLESLPQPLQLPPRLRELTLRQYWDINTSTLRPIGDTILLSSLDMLTLEVYGIGSHLQLPRDLRTLCLESCMLSERVLNGGGGGTGANGGRITQFPVLPDSLITLELESLYSGGDGSQHPVLTLPPNIQRLRVTCEQASEPDLMFSGPLGLLPPSLRTLVFDHPDGCAALPPLPPGLRALTLGNNLQRLSLMGWSPGGSLHSAIGPLPATLTHFTCWLDRGQEEDEDGDGYSSHAQLPLLPQGLQELYANGITLPAALPASLRVVRLGKDVDMSALEEPLDMPGRRVEVDCEYQAT